MFDHNTIPDDTGSLDALMPSIAEDIEVEVSHGPTLIDNNLLLSERSLRLCSQGLAIVHNLIAGSLDAVGRGTDNGAEKRPSPRYTPYHVPHATQVAGFMTFLHGDVRLLNNIFVATPFRPLIATAKKWMWPSDSQWDDNNYDVGTFPYSGYPTPAQWKAQFDGSAHDISRDAYYTHLPVEASGNVFLGGARPSDLDTNDLCSTTPVRLSLLHDRKGLHLSTNIGKILQSLEQQPADSLQAGQNKPGESEGGGEQSRQTRRCAVTTQALGVAFEPQERFENPDGTPISFTTDILGRHRSATQVEAGPFASLSEMENPLENPLN